MSLKVVPVAKVFAIIYAACSPLIVIRMVLFEANYFRIPLGLFAPL